MLCELRHVYGWWLLGRGRRGVQAYIHQLPTGWWGGAYSLKLSLCDEVFLILCLLSVPEDERRIISACFHSTKLSHSSSSSSYLLPLLFSSILMQVVENLALLIHVNHIMVGNRKKWSLDEVNEPSGRRKTKK